MRVVQINTVYGSGSTGRIVQDLDRGLARAGLDARVLYGRGTRMESANAIKTSTELEAKWNAAAARAYSLQYAGARRSTSRIAAYLRSERPDVVHLHNLNGYFVNIYSLLGTLESMRVPTVITLHAEFMYTGGCGHSVDCTRWLNVPGCGSCPQLREATKSLFIDRTRESWLRMRAAFEGDRPSIAVASVSPWLRARAESSPILRHLEHHTVLNGLDTTVFRPSGARAFGDISSSPNAGPIRLLHVTPYFTTEDSSWKGGQHVVELARLLGSRVRVDVVGRSAPNLRLPDNVRLLGRIDAPHALAAEYSAADAVLLTSRRETFSMVTAEALSCGTPVIGFRAGAPEQIALEDASHFVEPGNVQRLADVCMARLGPDGDLRNLDSGWVGQKAHERYSTDRMVREYIQLYRTVVMRKDRVA